MLKRTSGETRFVLHIIIISIILLLLLALYYYYYKHYIIIIISILLLLLLPQAQVKSNFMTVMLLACINFGYLNVMVDT